jgi:L-lactate utilization protein LutB
MSINSELIAQYNRLLAEKVIRGFTARNIEGHYCETASDAVEFVKGLIPTGSTVSWGGSATLEDIGLKKFFRGNPNYSVLDPKSAPNANERMEISRKAVNSDFFMMSANAIAETGEIVNIDGTGNRTSMLIFGPKNVIIVAGVNKIEMTLDNAILRAKTRAAALNVLTRSNVTPKSYEDLLKSAELIGKQIAITNSSGFPGRLKVILVGEDLGY